MSPRNKPEGDFVMTTRALTACQRHAGLLALLLVTTACTQPAAEVVLNGQNKYTRDGSMNVASNRSYSSSSYSAPAPSRAVSQTTYQSASVSSIGVSDLSAPPPVSVASTDLAAPTANKPAAIESKPAAVPAVNLWTKEPHFDEEAKNASEMKPAAGKAVQPASGILSAHNVKATPAAHYMWPVSSKKVVTSFGPKGGGRVSDGIDIASAEGEPVWAASDGEIVFVGDELKGYGNMVLIKHDDGKTTTYAHLSRASVDKYDRVKQGDIIGYVGTTGNVRDPQLFFAVNDGKTALDPQKYLSRNLAGL